MEGANRNESTRRSIRRIRWKQGGWSSQNADTRGTQQRSWFWSGLKTTVDWDSLEKSQGISFSVLLNNSLMEFEDAYTESVQLII